MSLKGEIVFHNSNWKKFCIDLVLVSIKVVDKVGIYEALVFLMLFCELHAFGPIHTSVTNLTGVGDVERRPCRDIAAFRGGNSDSKLAFGADLAW